MKACFGNSIVYAVTCIDMVFFDQEGVEQPDPMVVATATMHRVFLCYAQPRDGLARVQQLYIGTLHQV